MDHRQYTTNESERKPGKHLRLEDRGAIQAMKKLGYSNRKIAKYLHCSPTTVSNELRRGTPARKGNRGRTPGYSAKCGNAVYQANRKNSHKPHRIQKCRQFVEWVITQMREKKWSIDSCVGHARKHKLFAADEMVSTKTLYNEIWAGTVELSIMELPEALKRKKHCKNKRKRKKKYGTSIDNRLDVVNARIEEGHWEGDTVVGRRNGKEAVILTLLEKKTQYYIAIRICGKTSEAVNTAMASLREEYGERFSSVFKTITVDNGSEFADFTQVECWGTKVYYAHPYTSWERPQNERHNGMLRSYVPKGISIERFSDEEILAVADKMNSLPRKKLRYSTPEELFEAFLDIVYAA
jgi:IS30 family transposase